MTTGTPNPYLATKVRTASPAELRLMLLDGAIKFLEQGKKALAEKDHEASYNGISRCQSVLTELIHGLDPTLAPEICENLTALYTYMYTQLIKASSERDLEPAVEVLELLRYERETWVLLMQKLASENGAVPSPADTTAAAQATTDRSGDPHDLVGGRLSVKA